MTQPAPPHDVPLWGWILTTFGEQGYEDCAALYQLVIENRAAVNEKNGDLHPLVVGGTECYEVDVKAPWYDPKLCHRFDHHEYLHEQTEKDRRALELCQYANIETARALYLKAVDLLSELYVSGERVGGVTPPELAARVRAFLAASDWHEAVRAFTDGE